MNKSEDIKFPLQPEVHAQGQMPQMREYARTFWYLQCLLKVNEYKQHMELATINAIRNHWLQQGTQLTKLNEIVTPNNGRN
jgi:hypothetical protein